VSDFADLAGGGRALAPLLAAAPREGVVVLAVVPNGVPAALEVARALDAPLRGIRVDRESEGVFRVVLPEVADAQRLVVVDDAVEGGTAAVAIGLALWRMSSPPRVLAVPVCPRRRAAVLGMLYDDVVAAVWPEEQQELTAHYAVLEKVPTRRALALIERHEAGRQRR